MLTIYRCPGWYGMFVRMKVVVDDEYDFLLGSGESKQVPIAKNAKLVVIESRFQLKFNGRFVVKNPNQVKQVRLKLGFFGISCIVEHKNGNTVDLISKHHTAGFGWRR